LSKHGFSPATPDLADDLEKLETILRLVRELRASMFTARYGKRSVRWHDVAAAVAPLVVDIYRAAGRKTVDFQTREAAGVAAVRWALERFGYRVTDDAIAQHFKRARKARTIPPT
jgi:hypothetical protein